MNSPLSVTIHQQKTSFTMILPIWLLHRNMLLIITMLLVIAKIPPTKTRPVISQTQITGFFNNRWFLFNHTPVIINQTQTNCYFFILLSARWDGLLWGRVLGPIPWVEPHGAWDRHGNRSTWNPTATAFPEPSTGCGALPATRRVAQEILSETIGNRGEWWMVDDEWWMNSGWWFMLVNDGWWRVMMVKVDSTAAPKVRSHALESLEARTQVVGNLGGLMMVDGEC